MEDDLRAAKPDLSRVRIGQMFKRTITLPQFVENVDAASEQHFA